MGSIEPASVIASRHCEDAERSEGNEAIHRSAFRGMDCFAFEAGPGAQTREVAAGLNVDYDAKGEVVGFDIDHASRKLDLTTLETIELPVRAASVA